MRMEGHRTPLVTKVARLTGMTEVVILAVAHRFPTEDLTILIPHFPQNFQPIHESVIRCSVSMG